MLAGLIPWLTFSEAMSKSTTVIVSNANIVKQVVFPVEILPVKGVFASFVNQLILTVALVLYVLLKHHTLPWTYALIPLVLALQAMAMIGMSYVFSAGGAFFRDLKDFVQVFCVAGVYLMPTFYMPTQVPEIFRPFLWLNPFSYLTWCFQDVFFFGRIAHPIAWIIFTALCFGVFLGGYRFFRRLKLLLPTVL